LQRKKTAIMRDLLQAYKEKRPEIVFEWSDPLTEARGWVVINSLRNGAAGGGTRMRKGLTKEEVVSLAKVMEIKFSVSGPPIGGAKSGIDFDPNDPRRKDVLKRWFQAVFPLLKNYYGTGGDLNVDEIKDVIPITEELGLWHPQEGVVRGHLNAEKGTKINRIGQLRYGCAKIIEDPQFAPVGPNRKYAIADMVTGYGVAESVLQFYQLFRKSDIKGKRIIIQGWGNVASAAAYYLSKMGGVVVGIIDRAGGIIRPDGLTAEEVEQLFADKEGNQLAGRDLMDFETVNDQIWDVPADIFIPGAASKLITRKQVDRMIKAGIELISCGANVPFIDDEVFFGETAEYTDSRVTVIPDFIANCGMARVFAYLMEADREVTDAGIFEDIRRTIRKALKEVYDLSPDTTRVSEKALEIALLRSLKG